MRNLPEADQVRIVHQLRKDIPAMGLGFSAELITVEVIPGRDEGAFLWLAANYLLGKLDPSKGLKMGVGDTQEGDVILKMQSTNPDVGDQAFLCLGKVINGEQRLCRPATVGVLDMGGASMQIAFEFDAPLLVIPNSSEKSFRCTNK